MAKTLKPCGKVHFPPKLQRPQKPLATLSNPTATALRNRVIPTKSRDGAVLFLVIGDKLGIRVFRCPSSVVGGGCVRVSMMFGKMMRTRGRMARFPYLLCPHLFERCPHLPVEKRSGRYFAIPQGGANEAGEGDTPGAVWLILRPLGGITNAPATTTTRVMLPGR